MLTLRGLFAMARPLQLLSVIAVYALGVILAQAGGAALDFTAFAWGLAALLPVAVSIHYANEYADYETDALTTRTQFSGGSGAIPRGWVSRRAALVGAWAMLIIGISLGVQLLNLTALMVLLIGAFFGWMYSLPPLRLAWRGWGEVDNALLGGLALPLFGYAVAAGRIDFWVIAVCAPFTLLVFNNLLATTWTDRTADAAVGKYTLATRFSPRALRLMYLLVLVVAGVCILGYCTPPSKITALLTLPFALWGWWRYTRRDDPAPSVYAMIAALSGLIVLWFVAR